MTDDHERQAGMTLLRPTMVTSLQEICSGCQSMTAVTDTGPVEFSLQVKPIRPTAAKLRIQMHLERRSTHNAVACDRMRHSVFSLGRPMMLDELSRI